jgi:hypothetical protein
MFSVSARRYTVSILACRVLVCGRFSSPLESPQFGLKKPEKIREIPERSIRNAHGWQGATYGVERSELAGSK